MQVVGHHDPAVDRERMDLAHLARAVAQQADVPSQEVVASPPPGIDREEVGAAGVPGASVVGHGGMMAGAGRRRNALRLLRPTRAVLALSAYKEDN